MRLHLTDSRGFHVHPAVCAACLSLFLFRRAFELVNSPENHEKIGGILAIDELIDVQVKENDTKIIRFANYLRTVFPSPTADAETLRLAARTLGEWACGVSTCGDIVPGLRLDPGPCELRWVSLQRRRNCAAPC